MALQALKPDHNGAKNGGGAWLPRADAKRAARKLRRCADRAAVKAQEDRH